jgi:hypothetical protein
MIPFFFIYMKNARHDVEPIRYATRIALAQTVFNVLLVWLFCVYPPQAPL